MILPSDRTESSRTSNAEILRERKEGLRLTVARVMIFLWQFQSFRFVALMTTGSFESCFVLPPSPHATLHSHYPIVADIFSTVFSAAFVFLSAGPSLHFSSLVFTTAVLKPKSLIQFLEFASVRVPDRPSHFYCLIFRDAPHEFLSATDLSAHICVSVSLRKTLNSGV